MKKYFLLAFLFSTLHAFCQTKYSSVGGVESTYKDKYTFTAKLDEKTNTLSFETNAPVTVVTLETYTPAELSVRKGKEYLNTYTKKGQVYSYDLKKPLLKDKYAYWLKVSWGPNGAPLGEWFFRKKIQPVADTTVKVVVEEETANAATNPTLKTNIKCEAGKVKVITALKNLEGVFDVSIDIKTGLLKLNYSADGTPLNDIKQTILDNGFDVEGKKTTKPAANPCLKKFAK